MASILKSLRLAADPSRLRMLLLLEQEELSVAELQEILGKGQSQHLHAPGAVEAGRAGGRPPHRQERLLPPDRAAPELMDCCAQAAARDPRSGTTTAQALRLALRRRQDKMRALFRRTGGQVRPAVRPRPLLEGHRRGAAQADAAHGDRRPGRGRRNHFAIDGAAGQEGDRHRQFRKDGGIRRGARPQARHRATWNTASAISKTCPSAAGTVDLAFFSQALHHAQHPERAVAEACRILKPGGRIVVLDLLRHSYSRRRKSCTRTFGSALRRRKFIDFLQMPDFATWKRRSFTGRRGHLTSKPC